MTPRQEFDELIEKEGGSTIMYFLNKNLFAVQEFFGCSAKFNNKYLAEQRLVSIRVVRLLLSILPLVVLKQIILFESGITISGIQQISVTKTMFLCFKGLGEFIP